MNLFCLYKLQKKKGKFQHSSFLAGGATSAARKLVAQNGTLKVCNSYLQTALTPVLSGNMLTQPELYCWQAIWPHSGHYRPTEENFQEFKSFLNDNLVDLTDVKVSIIRYDSDKNYTTFPAVSCHCVNTTL